MSLKKLQLITPLEEVQLCFNCGIHPSQDCGYGEHTYSPNGDDFDCTHPNNENLECPCYETWCPQCFEKYINRRIIIIKSCDDCPNRFYVENQLVCSKTKEPVNEDMPIPKNCPLEYYEEEV